jgi:hypothetical protein
MTSNYSVTRDQIIIAALRKCGVVEPGDTSATIDANIIANTAVILNVMLKQWMTDGIKLWTYTEYVLPLVVSKTSYVIGPSGPDLTADKPLRLIQGNALTFARNISVSPYIDTPMQILSRQEYLSLGSKFSLGMTNSVYLDVQTTTSTLYVYQTPDTPTSTNYELHFTAQRPIYDITEATDTPDFPNEWMNALIWGLADQLAIENDVPLNHRQEIMARATMYKEKIEGWDTEAASTYFAPDYRYRNG